MNFEKEINELEEIDYLEDFIYKIGKVPILFTAPHTMIQCKEDGTIKLNEPYTKAIALYLNKYLGTSYLIKINDTGIDSNRENDDPFKDKLNKLIKDNNIKLVIDLHGASITREFDVEFGTLNNLSADYSVIKELEQALTNHGITEIYHNDPFIGGAITRSVYEIENVDVIQLEINGKYRNYSNIEKLKDLIDALMEFINKYNEKS